MNILQINHKYHKKTTTILSKHKYLALYIMVLKTPEGGLRSVHKTAKGGLRSVLKRPKNPQSCRLVPKKGLIVTVLHIYVYIYIYIYLVYKKL